MKKIKVLFSGLIGLLLLVNLLIGHSQENQKIRIVTTIFPLTEIARAVVGNRGDIFQLIPTGAEVHDFQLRPSDVSHLHQADLILAVGPRLEPWLKKIEGALNGKPGHKIYFYEELESEDFPGLVEEDPHLWLDLKADELLTGALVKTLGEIDPGGQDYYRQRGQRFQAELSALDRAFKEQLKTCSSDIFIVAGHQAFGYLARRYNLELYSLVGANPEARPGLKKIQEIIELIKREKVKAIFYESSVNPYYAQTIARETGVKLYPLSTGVHLKPEEVEKNVSFLQLMKQNLETMRTALECPETRDDHD